MPNEPSNPHKALVKVVVEALTARGFSGPESEQIVARLSLDNVDAYNQGFIDGVAAQKLKITNDQDSFKQRYQDYAYNQAMQQHTSFIYGNPYIYGA